MEENLGGRERGCRLEAPCPQTALCEGGAGLTPTSAANHDRGCLERTCARLAVKDPPSCACREKWGSLRLAGACNHAEAETAKRKGMRAAAKSVPQERQPRNRGREE